MSRKYFLAEMGIVGIVGLVSFLAVFFLSASTQGIFVKIIFNLSVFICITIFIFFISVLLKTIFIKALKKDNPILGDEWAHFRRGVFIGLSFIFFSYLSRANLFHWLEVLFLIVLFFGWEFIYFKSKRLSVVRS